MVKIAGHPAKKPSFWINRADFVRQYQKIGQFWVPYRDETLFTISHEKYLINRSEGLSNDSRPAMK